MFGRPRYVGDDYIWSTTGVQQGDPLGPLLFALVLHPLVHRIRDCCQLLFHAWYLDDGTIIGDTKEVAKAIDIIRAEGPRLGLELNIKKTKVFWPSCNGVKVKEGLFPPRYWETDVGCETPWRRVYGTPQLELLLLRSCLTWASQSVVWSQNVAQLCI
ncbi:putative reverse transcriptase domain-containing protein [Tanacetum coccineum]